MATEFRLPELGEDIESGEVVRVLVSAGDRVAENETVMEVETDKATIEIPAPLQGAILAVHVKAGDKVNVGGLLITIAEDAPLPKSAEASIKPASPEKPLEQKQQVDTAEVPKESPSRARENDKAASPPKSVASSPEPAPASPSVRRLARELGVDVNLVSATGLAGRISEDDVKNYVRTALIEDKSERGGESSRTPVRETPELPDFSKWGEIERAPMSNIRQRISDAMTHSWTTAPHVSQHNKADITKLDALRRDFAPKLQGGKLTVTAILIKIAASALVAFPKFASSLDAARAEIIYKKYRHIGIAVDTERGLVVPVIRDADKKNIAEISAELALVSERARSRKITPEELRGGVFTISNQGSVGGGFFSPIIYTPQVAILGVSRAQIEPRFIDGGFEPRLMLPLSLSHDHRVIDGADAVRFMNWIIEALEEPFKLLVEG
ncbi:MAG: 2-oxo acid dehydrogenase subunit E2 [Deltaproteobacteria bacterium]